jgi:RIO kinase 2
LHPTNKLFEKVEMGSKNHEIVPTDLISKLSGLRGGSGVHKNISNLAKVGLIAKVPNARYDGYRLTYGGMDYLALHSYSKRDEVYSVGNQIGVGKESDIYVVADEAGTQHVMKIHRLGRISFRTVKTNRDYLKNRHSKSWQYMSTLAAKKEFAFMEVLHEHNFPVPIPISQNRHTILMSLVDAFPLRQITDIDDPAGLYSDLMDLILRLARYGLIHGDFNEFNILILDSDTKDPVLEETANTPTARTLTPILIDFPQTLSIDHPDAEFYFNRDVSCIKAFFKKRFHFTPDNAGPFFKDARKLIGRPEKIAGGEDVAAARLDIAVSATGFSRQMAKELEKYMKAVGVDGDGAGSIPQDEESDAESSEGDDEEVHQQKEPGMIYEDQVIDSTTSHLILPQDSAGSGPPPPESTESPSLGKPLSPLITPEASAEAGMISPDELSNLRATDSPSEDVSVPESGKAFDLSVKNLADHDASVSMSTLAIAEGSIKNPARKTKKAAGWVI